jgi:hypothetical protein
MGGRAVACRRLALRSMLASPEVVIPVGHIDTHSVRWSLDVHFIYTLPVLVTSRHSRESGNPGDKSHGDWMPACAGMTFYWRRTYETDI